MQFKNLLTLSLLGLANASPLRNRGATHSLSARAPPNVPSDLDSYGLKKDSWERKYYDAFIKWEDDKVDDGAGLDKYWVFWAGPNVEDISKWAKEYNDDGKYHDGLKPDDKKKITIPGEVYPDIEGVEDLQKVQSEWMDDKEDQLEKIVAMPIAMMSWRGAQRAAQAGGIVRYVGKEGEDNVPDKRIWSSVEAYELTKEGSKVESIERYNFGKGGVKQIWKKGDKPLGSKVNFEKWNTNEDEAKKAFEEELKDGKDKYEDLKEEIKDEAD